MSDELSDIDWRGTDEKMVREIYSQAQAFSQAQLQSALASDQRAMTFAAILVTLSAAGVAAAAALYEKLPHDALIGIGVMAFTLLIAATFAAWAARPIDFFYPGSRPEEWYENRKEDFVEMLGGAAERTQTVIDENERFMDGNQEAIRAALILAIFSPIFGAVFWWMC